MKKLLWAVVCAAAVNLPGTAQAALIVSTSVSNIGTDNVINNGCTSTTLVTSGQNFVQGCLNQNKSVIVDFTSNELLEYAQGGGQATIKATVGTFDSMTIDISQPLNTTFSKLVLNIDASEAGFVTFFGVPGGFADPIAYALKASGQNFFTITGEDFSSLTFTTTVGITGLDIVDNIAQVRLGGLETSEPQCPTLPIPCVINPEVIVPEPTSLALLGLGLLGAGVVRRRR